MKQRDREGFVSRVRDGVARGLSITEAIEHAYAWLLKRSKEAWPS
jgi:hypothetical protein